MLHKGIHTRLVMGLGAVALSALLFAVGSVTNGDAATAPGLGAAASYAVLGGQTVTNTGPTTIDGDLGVWPGTSVTNFPPGIVTGGTIHEGDSHAQLAQDAVTTAYNALSAEPCSSDLTGQDLGGMTLTAGVYCFTSSAQLTGALTLDAEGSADAVFIFKTVSTLTTASSSTVDVINGGVDCNVFWRVGSSAPIGTGTVFVGNILALTSISLATGASVSGRALARNGEVTLQTNHVGFLGCAVATATPTTAPTGTPLPTPVGQTPSATPVGQTPTATPSPTPVGPTASPTPVGQTPTATPSPTPVGSTPTAIPSPTPAGPTLTATPSPTPVDQTPTATPTLPPPPAPTITPSPAVPGFPNSGGPPQQEAFPWTWLVIGLAFSGIGATTIVLSRRNRLLRAQRAE